MNRKLKRSLEIPLLERVRLRLCSAVLFCALIATAPASTNRHPDPGNGFIYRNDKVADVPWSIHFLKVDRTRADLRFETSLGAGNQIGMSLVSEQVKTLPAGIGKPIAAVNGDFYKSAAKYPGDPEGLQIIRGELVSAPSPTRSCFWIDASGQPHQTNVQSQFKVTLPGKTSVALGLNEERGQDQVVLYTAANGASTKTTGGFEVILKRSGMNQWLPLAVGETYTAIVQQVNANGDSPLTTNTMVLSAGPRAPGEMGALKPGDTVQISTATGPNVRGARVALGGGPALVRGSKEITFKGLQPRHPRVALGWNKQSFFLVEVDGRQSISAGMSFPELATYMLNLGCEEAINLDGGGSATMWVYGNVMNSPSEGRERPAANALILMRREPAN